MKRDLRIIFMGTPEFAVPSLDILIKNKINVVGVITVPDKPAGRGLQLQSSPVKEYALQNNIPVLQPEKLKDPAFLEQLKELKADLQIVVAFRMLPEAVWNMPPLGTFNLHASLLPQYRGAAPINHAIINGEKETGVTTFFLEHEIDTGKIIFREKVKIGDNDTAGNLHDRMMATGAELVLKTVKAIADENYTLKSQSRLSTEELKPAPKIFKEDCRIKWNNPGLSIYNKIRGLSPYPCAFTELNINGNRVAMKIYETEIENKVSGNSPAGTVLSDNKTHLKIASSDGFVNVKNLQLSGKKRMNVEEFLRGFNTETIINAS